MNVHNRTVLFRKLLYYLVTSIFILSAGIAMAAGTDEIRTPDNDTFELEGNSVPNEITPPNQFDDFDEVYRDITSILHADAEAAEAAGGGLLSPGVDTDAFIEIFQWDDFRDLSPAAGGFAGSTTFMADPTTAGPGMKDGNSIFDWHCVTSANLGAKFDLRQTYLAFYKKEHVGADHLLMFGGGVRDSNNGSAAIGFWLFRSEVACQSDPNAPNFERFVKPDGSIAEHVEGDILLVSDFTAGGRVSNIHAWKWMGDDATGGPVPLTLPASKIFGDCLDTTSDEMIMCGIANTANITLEWDPRSTLTGSTPNVLQHGQFFEGGVDLTELTGAGINSCINSFILETRASHRITAKLHDFVGGSLNTCGTIIVRKYTTPASDTTEFSFNLGTYDAFQLADTEEKVFSSVLQGTYALSESTPPAGWTLDNAECGLDTDGNGEADDDFFDPRDEDIVVGLNEVYICTFHNVQEATLTLEKTVINDNGGTLTETNFQAKIDGGPVDWDTAYTYNPSTSGVDLVASEVEQAGYAASKWGGDCAEDGSVTLYPGDNKTCTITNDDISPTLTLIKTVVNDNGGTLTQVNFPAFVDATPQAWDATVDYPVGTYTVSETPQAGYAPSVWSGDCAADGSVTLALDQDAVCYITNDDISPTLKLVKTVVNDDGGTLTQANFPAFVDAIPQAWDATVDHPVGTYTVSETPQAGYAPSVWSGDCAADGSVTLALDQDAVCYITNDDISPTLTLVKTVVNDDGGTLTQANFPSFCDATPHPWDATVDLPAGTYTASETSHSGYVPSVWSGDCAADGSITLALDQDAVCYITNDDIPPASCAVGDRVTSVTLQVTALASSPVELVPVERHGQTITDVVVIDMIGDHTAANLGTTFRVEPLGGAANFATQNLGFYIDGDQSKQLKVHLSCSDDPHVGDVHTGDGIELTKVGFTTGPKQ